MPSHYEAEYSFAKKTEPGAHGSGPLPEDSRPHPAYATADGSLTPVNNTISHWPHEILHEVQNSDTLEKLARRYLGDPARALEIFDLNRDKLKNPEILPIGAELRIPQLDPTMGE
jgi:nucleoid-associated protein YgaU